MGVWCTGRVKRCAGMERENEKFSEEFTLFFSSVSPAAVGGQHGTSPVAPGGLADPPIRR